MPTTLKIQSCVFMVLLLVGMPLKTRADTKYHSTQFLQYNTTLLYRTGLNVQKIAQNHTATTTSAISKIGVYIKRNSGDATSASLTMKVYEGGGTPEAGTLKATSNATTSATISETGQVVYFTFNSSWLESSGLEYWYIIESTDLDDPRFTIGVNSSPGGLMGWRYCPGCGGNDWQNADGATWAMEWWNSATVEGYTETQVEGITTVVTPTQNSVTSNNTPLFSYTYYTTRAHDRAGFILRDLTTNQTINTSEASTTISSTGSHTYAEYFGLTTGHLYNWTPYVYTVDGSLPPLYGRSQSFFVETTANYQSLVTQTATTSNPFATSSIYYSSAYATSTNGKITISTSTILQRCPISFLPQVLAEQMQVKLPFSYICDFNRLILELANGDGNTEGNIVAAIPNNFNGSTTNMTFLDQTAIQNLDQLSAMQNVLRYTIYFLTALAIVSMALGVF